MTPFWGADRAIAEWAAQRIPDCEHGFGECRAMGVEHGSQVVAAVIFHNWSEGRGVIELSAAADDRRWLTRRVANEAMTYTFAIARLAVARTSELNRPVRRIWRALGAQEHRIPELWKPGEAEIILTLRPEGWAQSSLCEVIHG